MRVLVGVMLLAGLCLVFYPMARNWLYDQSVRQMQLGFEQHAGQDGLDDEEARRYEALYEYLVGENERLYEERQSGLADAFSYEQPAVDLSAWGIADNCIGVLSIPSIGSDMPIYLGANNEQMAKGAVHLTQTSYPVGGDNTNSVIAAHRGSFNGLSMLWDVEEVQVGDMVYVTNFRETLVYRVVEQRVIAPDDIDQLLIQDGRDLVTLITCHPQWSNYERYVLYCERVR